MLKRIPDSVQALIAARIDGLDDDDRRLLQRAALVGRVFWRGALDALSPGLDVGSALDRLLEREFIAPEARSSISGERAFQFTHGLIREVAYATVSKAQRAEDHRRLAAWVAERAPDELADIRAHHLDAAATLVAELEGAVPADLAEEAAAALEAAGRRSMRRGSFGVARSLLLRAVELEPTLDRRCLAAQAAWRLSDVPTVRDEARSLLEDARAAHSPMTSRGARWCSSPRSRSTPTATSRVRERWPARRSRRSPRTSCTVSTRRARSWRRSASGSATPTRRAGTARRRSRSPGRWGDAISRASRSRSSPVPPRSTATGSRCSSCSIARPRWRRRAAAARRSGGRT